MPLTVTHEMLLAITCSFLVSLATLAILHYFGCQRDKKIWNNGICAENNLPWEIRDVDSHGGYLLRSGEGDKVIRVFTGGYLKLDSSR